MSAPLVQVLSDQAERDAIAGDLDHTMVVEASAGTGKTSELVRRIVAMLSSGRASLDRLVAVTFTDQAAGELKLRIRVAIEEARLATEQAEVRRRLEKALPKLEEARIGTIHSFCTDLLRERPVEAGVDPHFEVAAGDQARRLLESAFGAWFESQLESSGPGVRRILRRWKREPMFGRRLRRGEGGPRDLLRKAAEELVRQRHFPAAWRRDPGFERNARIDALLEAMEAVAELAGEGDPGDWFTKSLLEIARVVDEVRRAERVRERDHDALEARLCDAVSGKQGKHWGWRGRPFSQKARERRDALYAELQTFAADSGADLAPLLRDELWPVVTAYEAAKEKVGCLDFDDLLIRTRDLLLRDVEVRRELQARFDHFFVDEYQDTDPLQTEILMLLAADDPTVSEWRQARVVPGKLFLVGDPKQSIYRFRRADVTLYRDVQERLMKQGARLVRLTVSFRSVPAIQDAVNAAFADRLGGDVRENDSDRGYVPLAPFRDASPAQPALVALPVPAPYSDWSYPKIVDYKIDESEPDVTAAWIQWLVRESGWTVTERERPGERVPVEPRHICVLFRRFRSFNEDTTRRYREALEARGLPHLLIGGSSLHEREEIEALRNALSAIERPDDELSVFATLRGPLLALSDAALLAWRERAGHLHPFRPIPEELSPQLQEVAEAMELLRELHRARNRQPVAHTIARLLEATRAHAAFAIWPNGMQALANVGRLVELARRAEQEGLVSFRAFIDRLEEDAESGEAAEGPMLEEGIEGVRLMTVHKAKGLEFPIVILADMTAKETLEHPLRWTDPERGLCVQRLAGCTPIELREHGAEEQEREREEALRLLYVASTRARDVLVVPVIGDERRESWLSALWPAVYPATKNSRKPVAEEAPGVPAFGEESVPGRPASVMRPFISVRPGVHAPERGDHRVVWWDPGTLELNVRATNGLAQTAILEEEEGGRAGEAGAAYERWKLEREESRKRGGRPTHEIAPATEWLRSSHKSEDGSIQVMEVTREGDRPRGRRFGTLVHAVLSVVGLDDDRDQVARHTLVQSRLLGASEAEREAAVETVASALGHPLMRRAARAEHCRRESPLVVRAEDGTLLESVVDLAFLEDGTWQVVDFKSDAELETLLDVYRRQVALYVRGIAQATGLPARGTILKI